MRRWPLALLLATACLDDTLCPWVSYVDGFQLVLTSERWSMAQYSIQVSYTDESGSASFRCDVPIPALPPLDAGSTLAADAGIDARGQFACTPEAPTGRLGSGQAGQQLVLGFEGTPTSAHVIVSDMGRLVLEQDVALSYQILRPAGDDCPGPKRAFVGIELPQSSVP